MYLITRCFKRVWPHHLHYSVHFLGFAWHFIASAWLRKIYPLAVKVNVTVAIKLSGAVAFERNCSHSRLVSITPGEGPRLVRLREIPLVLLALRGILSPAVSSCNFCTWSLPAAYSGAAPSDKFRSVPAPKMLRVSNFSFFTQFLPGSSCLSSRSNGRDPILRNILRVYPACDRRNIMYSCVEYARYFEPVRCAK